jgi:hypothetical protein
MHELDKDIHWWSIRWDAMLFTVGAAIALIVILGLAAKGLMDLL